MNWWANAKPSLIFYNILLLQRRGRTFSPAADIIFLGLMGSLFLRLILVNCKSTRGGVDFAAVPS